MKFVEIKGKTMVDNQIKAVFLDIDNTLLSFDGYVKQTMEKGFAHFGLKTYESWMFDKFTEINNGLWQRIEQGSLTFPQLQEIRWNLVFEALGITFDGRAFEIYFRKMLWDSAIPEDGAYELLEALSKHYILCAASNGPYDQQMHRLEIADMKKYFDYFFISEKIGVSKPAEEFFEVAFRELNHGREQVVLPSQCLMIGDSLTSDIAGAENCGMQACFYNRSGKNIMKENVYVANTLPEIRKYVEKLRK